MRMKKLSATLILVLGVIFWANAQPPKVKIKPKTYKTISNIEVQGEVGYLTVPENRSNENSRMIKVKFIRLKSISESPKEPIFYLEGGGGASTWQAEDPSYLNDWLPILEVSDLIFVDLRGSDDNKLRWIKWGDYPANFLVSEEEATGYYQETSKRALKVFEKRGVDVLGYNVVESSRDVEDIREALGIDTYAVFGFSYGSHIAMSLIRLYEEHISNAILIGADGLNQYFNYPSLLDEHVNKISKMVATDSALNREIPDFEELVHTCLKKLKNESAIVEVVHPLSLTKKKIKVKVGDFGLSLILRLDIDDASDIPVIPKLLYDIDRGDYSLLQWFVQKRIAFAFQIPGSGLNQGISAGASDQRWKRIEQEAKESPFGNVVNFPFAPVKEMWPTKDIGMDMIQPIQSKVRTLFISGDLDCRTPVSQTEEIKQVFSNSIHLVVENAGHEQSMWNAKIFDEAIPEFLKGEDVNEIKASNREIKFIPLEGSDKKSHPSLSIKN